MFEFNIYLVKISASTVKNLARIGLCLITARELLPRIKEHMRGRTRFKTQAKVSFTRSPRGATKIAIAPSLRKRRDSALAAALLGAKPGALGRIATTQKSR